jgi:hypothetical protein
MLETKVVFENILVPEISIIQCAASSLSAYLKANTKAPDPSSQARTYTRSTNSSSTHRHSNQPSRWTRPDPNFVKINSDANLQVAGRWGLGCIIRNEEGVVQASVTWCRNEFENAVTAEAFAIYAALVLTLNCGF